jgi:fucose permease
MLFENPIRSNLASGIVNWEENMRTNTQPPMGRRATLFLAHWIFFALGLGESSLAPSFPTLAKNMDVPLEGLGILFTARAVGFIAVFITAGWLTARLGRGRLMVGALATAALAWSVLPSVDLLPFGVILVLLSGLGAAALSASVNALVGDLNPHDRAVAINRLYLFIAMAAFVGPLLVGTTLSFWRMIGPAFWLAAAMMLVSLIPLAWLSLPELPPAIRRIGSSSLRQDRRLWLLAAFLFLFLGVDAGFNGWIYSYVRTSLRGEIALASAAASAFWLAAMVGRFARMGPFRRVPDGPLMVGSCVSGLIAIVLLILLRTPLVAVAASVWLGFSTSTLYPTAMSLGLQLRPSESVAVISLLGVASATGSLTLPWLYGQFLRGEGQGWPMALLVNLILVLGLALAVSIIIDSNFKPHVYLTKMRNQMTSLTARSRQPR